MLNVINRLGFRILESRVAKGLTQEELGILVGLKSPRLEIWQFELGVKSPRFEILEKIANNLDLTVYQLYTCDNSNVQSRLFVSAHMQ